MSTIEERVKKIIGEQLGVKQEEVVNSASFVEEKKSLILRFRTKKLRKSLLFRLPLITSTATRRK